MNTLIPGRFCKCSINLMQKGVWHVNLRKVDSVDSIVSLIREIGFLPFFRNDVPGFSLEECVDKRFWFPDTGEGVWEWKGPVIQRSGCAYGKFFRNKAGFISMDWFPDFANYRRDGYDFDALYDDGLAKNTDKKVWEFLQEHKSLLTGELKKLGDFRKGGNKGFDSIITRLQMQCYVVVAGFEYKKDKSGKSCGWGVARYETPEYRFGEAFTGSVYRNTPGQSKEKIVRHLEEYVKDSRVLKIL